MDLTITDSAIQIDSPRATRAFDCARIDSHDQIFSMTNCVMILYIILNMIKLNAFRSITMQNIGSGIAIYAIQVVSVGFIEQTNLFYT
jgi:hypothetical protein